MRPESVVGLTTEDIDVAVPAYGQRHPRLGDSLLQRLRENEFEPGLPVGSVGKRVYDFQGDVQTASYLQLVAPRGAPGRARASKDYGGLEVSELDRLELLLASPWESELSGHVGRLRVACPAAFLVHKLLVLDKRLGLDRKAKDLVYLRSTLRCFAPSLEQVAEAASVLPLKAKDRKRMRSNLDRFVSADHDAVHRGAMIASEVEGDVSGAELVATIRFGLTQVVPCLAELD